MLQHARSWIHPFLIFSDSDKVMEVCATWMKNLKKECYLSSNLVSVIQLCQEIIAILAGRKFIKSLDWITPRCSSSYTNNSDSSFTAEYLYFSSKTIWNSNPTSNLQSSLACCPANPLCHTSAVASRKITFSS